MKKAVLATFALLVLLLFIAGCAGMSAEDLVKKAYAASSKANTYNIDSSVETESELGMQGETMSTKSTVAAKAAVDRSNRRLFMDVSVQSQGGLLGDSESKSEGYIIGNTVYEKDKLGKWYKGAVETDVWKSMENISQMDALLSLIKASDVSAAQTESIDGRENYVVKVSPDVLRLMESYGVKTTGATAEEMRKAVKEYTITVWVDKETFLVSKAAVRIRMESESSGSYVKITMKMDMRFYNYNKPANIELPKEAENAVDRGRFSITRPGQATSTQDSAKEPVAEQKAAEKKTPASGTASFSAKGEGELCVKKDDCLKELACYKGKCRAFAGEGAACEEADSSWGKIYGCKEGLRCDWGVCVANKVGEPCYSTRCGGGLTCIQNKCSEYSDIGSPCDDITDCRQMSGWVCDKGKCVQSTLYSDKGEAGASCKSWSDCKAYLQCYKGACRGYGKIGDACDSYSDCQRIINGRATICYKGKCREPGKEGESCDWLGDCDTSGDYLTCYQGVCRRPAVKLGEKCDAPWVTGCSEGTCLDGVCVAHRNEGESCDPKKGSDYWSNCENGLQCYSDDGKTGVCRKFVAMGGECDRNKICLGEYAYIGWYAQHGLRCSDKDTDGKGVCAEGSKSKGESCSYENNSVRCRFGIQCYNGKCREYGSTGDDCVSETDCREGLQCYKGKCREWGKAGNDCVNYLHCDFGLACYKGFCRQSGQAGDECINSNDCRRGLYCTSGRCA